MSDEQESEPADLRMPALAAAAWAGALAGAGGPIWLAAVGGLSLAAAAVTARRRPRARVLAGALLLVLAASATTTTLRLAAVSHSPVASLAEQGAAATVVGTVTSDAVELTSGPSDRVLWRLRAAAVRGRGQVVELGAPVLVLADADSARPPLGATVRLSGRLVEADGDDLAAMLIARGDPDVVRGPDVWWRAAAAVRASLRASVEHRPDAQRALVPALVVGDDAGLPTSVEADFQTSGLTHLLAVSGTNLTLLVGFVLVLARWSRVRGRWLLVVAAAGIAGFVLLARTEPSVLRAAAMGAVGLVALSHDGGRRGFRSLGVAVLVLVLVEPGLARQAGFVLSVLATAGIVVLAPGMRDALARWLPRWLAEAVAVPLAAQLACTPVVAAISGQVSMVAVLANLMAAPVVGPATVLGLAAGLVGLLWPPLGTMVGTLAAWCVGWIVAVAERGAALPMAAVDWGTGPWALTVLTAVVAALALLAPHLLRRPVSGLACCLLLVVVVLVEPGARGWPPDGWVVVACDVGQGDAVVLSAGPGTAVVVDAGPDPRTVDGCLDDLGVQRVPLVVLTHFHADHVDGLPGVLRDRSVDAVLTTTLLDPPGAVADVTASARAVGVEPRAAVLGETVRIGTVTLQTLWPQPSGPTTGPGDGSTANDASVVMLAETAGVRVLLTGDAEPHAQGLLARSVPGLDVDVLKMPHHGSAHQSETWLVGLRPEVVLVSVGAGNDYGHPAASALEPLEAAGAQVGRTDRGGDQAVVVRDGVPTLVSRR